MENLNLSVKELTLLLLAFFLGICALAVPNIGGKEFQLIGAGLGLISGGAFIVFLLLKLFKNNKSTTKD